MSDDNKIIKVDFGAKRVVRDDEPAKFTPPVDMPDDPETAKKLVTILKMLESGTVMVTLDARKEGVEVPSIHRENAALHLNFDYEFGIPDFAVDADGVRASLSFGGRDHWCDIPWAAVYAMRGQQDDELMVFPKSFPDELRETHPGLEILGEDDED